MSLYSGKESATAAAIFNKMDCVLQESSIPWDNCVGVSVDNTSVNLGKTNSIFTRVMVKNSAIYFMGCPCHIAHNTSMKATESFSKYNGLSSLPMCTYIYVMYFDLHCRLPTLMWKI